MFLIDGPGGNFECS